MFKKLFLVIITSVALFSMSYEEMFEKDFRKLNREQLEMLMEIAKRAKPYDLVYSAVAIAWQESNLGKWQINLKDPSCGPFHQVIPLFLKKNKIANTEFNRNKVCSELIDDIDLSVSTVISELEAWKMIHKNRMNVWDYVYRSYNAGYNYDSATAKKYSKMIRARIKVLKKYL